MADALIQFAEEEFLKKRFQKAYEIARLALQLDPFYADGYLHKYVAAYRVHYAAASSKDAIGFIDWYDALGMPHDSPEQAILHRFRMMGKLIDPDENCFAAAKGAYDIISTAVDVLGNAETRIAFHRRWMQRPHLRAIRSSTPVSKTQF